MNKNISIPVAGKFFLNISDIVNKQDGFATSRLPKGFVLVSRNLELAEEAVGFGFPVVKRGIQALFPGCVELTCERHGSIWSVTTHYLLNRVEKIQNRGNGSVGNPLFYAVKNTVAAVIRQASPLRDILTFISSGLRNAFNWQTTYENTGFSVNIKMVHIIDEITGKIKVEIDSTTLPGSITEVVIMNEQGARTFDCYQDSSGVALQGKKIGCWDEVKADSAWFFSSSQPVSFKLSQVKGSRLFRGRELVGSRLAWAGFGYSFPPRIKNFSYELEIAGVP